MLKNKIWEYENYEIENELSRRLDERPVLKFDIIRVASNVIIGTSSPFITSLWHSRSEEDSLVEYAKLLANSFESDQGILEYLAQLDNIKSEKELNDQIRGLMYFNSPEVNYWIEIAVDRVTNITSTWGVVSALSDVNWDTLKKWINLGRPLSLVALDALSEYATDNNTMNSSPLSRERILGLPDPPSKEEILEVINNYQIVDSVPRVKQGVNHIKFQIDKITRRSSEI